MNDLINYDFQGNGVRVVMIDDEPWFVAKDVCDVLGLTNPSMAVSELDDDEKSEHKDYLGSGRKPILVNEPGLYSLILRSRKPEAKAFKRWVTHDVLPEIRKTGGYGLPKTFGEALQLAADQQRKIEQQEKQIGRLVHDNRTYTATDLAKELGYRSAVAFNQDLHDRGIIYKDSSGVWVLYAQYADRGFQQIKQQKLDNGHVVYYAKWTGVGREWLLGVMLG